MKEPKKISKSLTELMRLVGILKSTIGTKEVQNEKVMMSDHLEITITPVE